MASRASTEQFPTIRQGKINNKFKNKINNKLKKNLWWPVQLTDPTAHHLVSLHHVGWNGAVQTVGHFHRVVDWVLHQRPGGEGRAGHQDGAVEQSCSLGQNSRENKRSTRFGFTADFSLSHSQSSSSASFV